MKTFINLIFYVNCWEAIQSFCNSISMSIVMKKVFAFVKIRVCVCLCICFLLKVIGNLFIFQTLGLYHFVKMRNY